MVKTPNSFIYQTLSYLTHLYTINFNDDDITLRGIFQLMTPCDSKVNGLVYKHIHTNTHTPLTSYFFVWKLEKFSSLYAYLASWKTLVCKKFSRYNFNTLKFVLSTRHTKIYTRIYTRAYTNFLSVKILFWFFFQFPTKKKKPVKNNLLIKCRCKSEFSAIYFRDDCIKRGKKCQESSEFSDDAMKLIKVNK